MSFSSDLLSFFSPVSTDDYQTHIKTVVAFQPVTSATPRRPPGRPRKRNVASLVDFSSSSSPSPSPPTPSCHSKRSRYPMNWFSPAYIHDILEAIRLTKSARSAVHYLQTKYRALPTETNGRFDWLNESTIRCWFDEEWKLKPQYQLRLEAECNPNMKGKKSILEEYPAIVERIQTRLRRMREDDTNATINIDIARTIIMKIVKKYGPEIVDKLKFSRNFISCFLRHQMGWSLRRGTTVASKLPEDWIEQGVAMAKRIAALISMHDNIHKALIVNLDQTGVELVPASNTTYDKKGKKSIAIVGQDDKRQITAVVASSPIGVLLPLQLIFGGKTDRCHPPIPDHIKQSGFHITHSDNHWSNQQTMKQYVEHIINPYYKQQIRKYSLPSTSKLILQLDCWSVHKSAEFISYIKSQHKHIHLVFIPPNCTSKLQVADVVLQRPFKWGVKKRFNEWLANIIEEQIENEEEKIQINPHLRMSSLKPLLLEWVYQSWSTLGSEPELIMKAWNKCLSETLKVDPFDEAVQKQSVLECAKGQLTAFDFKYEKEEEEKELDWESEEEEEDELDLMKQITIGTRRSGRQRKEAARKGYCIDTSLVEIESEDEA
jgi:hypothetical protein